MRIDIDVKDVWMFDQYLVHWQFWLFFMSAMLMLLTQYHYIHSIIVFARAAVIRPNLILLV